MQARTMQGKVCLFLFILFLVTTTVPAGETPDLYKNQLHFGYGINYKITTWTEFGLSIGL